MKKRLLSVMLAGVMMFSLAACGNSAEDSKTDETSGGTKKSETEESEETGLSKEDLGTINVGIDGAYPPYCFLNDETDETDGFEVAMMREIADRNGLDIQCVVTAWDGMFSALDSGRIDTVAESITITEERKADYIFSTSYIEASNRFIVREGEEASITSFEDLAGKKIGVASGQEAYSQLEKMKEEYKVDFEIVPYDSSTNAYDVSIGRLDASYMNPIAALSTSEAGEMKLTVAECPAYVADYCGYAFVKDSERAELLEQIFSGTIKEMHEDGTLKSLCEEWLGADVSTGE